MSLFGHSNKDEQSVLLATIESGAVHATLCLMHPHNKPFIVHSVTKPIAFQETLDFDRFASATLQSLADACQEIVTKGVPHVASRRLRKGHIDAVYCTYGSPWYVSQTQHVDITKAEPVLVTRELISELSKEHGVSGGLLSLSDKNDAPNVIEQNIVDIKLNGYPVADPYGKSARRISFSLLSGAVSRSFSKYTQDVIGRFFGTQTFYHHAGPSTLFLGVRDTMATDDSYLILDVSAELTDVSVIRNGVLTETVTFPNGVRTCMRNFAKAARIMPNEVLGVMQGMKDGKIDPTKLGAYQTAADETKRTWRAAFDNAVLPLSELTPIPKRALLFGDSGEFVRVKDTLVPTTLLHPKTADEIVTTLVLSESFSSFCLIREGVRLGHPLVPLSALYVHRLLTMRNG